MANATTLQLGSWTPSTDAFVAHPYSPTGAVYDLNDNVAWTLVDDQEGFGVGLNIDPPAPEVLKSKNSRAIGERVTRRNYSSNRKIVAKLLQIPQSTAAAWNNNLRQLIQLCEAISPTTPAALKIQLTSSSAPVYADVLEAHIRTRYKETLFAQYMNDEVVVELDVRPFLRGSRVTLQNLVTNPGFEAPGGTQTNVFYDTFANIDAYTTGGGAPSVASNILSLPANALVTFGSPSWNAATWQVRFQYTAIGGLFRYFLHYTNGSNWLAAQVFSGTNGLNLLQTVAGTQHSLGTATQTLTANNWYWFVITQFPAPYSGTQPQVAVSLYNDSAGAIGTLISTIGPVATFDAVTALTGVSGMTASTAQMNVGGAFNGVHSVSLFGPGGWYIADSGTGLTAYGWEQTSNRYQGGPQMSYGTARMDFAPAGTVISAWKNCNTGSPSTVVQTGAPIAAAGDTIMASAWVKTTAVASTFRIFLQLNEYDSGGNLLRQTNTGTISGAQLTYTQVSITVTTGANTAYVMLAIVAQDTSAGANATNGGSMWIDNVLMWDATATGQTTMPYCELRFPQSPAQILVSGIAGDVPAPVLLQVGAYFSTFAAGTTLSLRIGRRLNPTFGWHGVLWPIGSGSTSTQVASLSATRYGGVNYLNSTGGSSNQFFFNPVAYDADYVGTYHLFLASCASSETTANCPNITTRINAFLQTNLGSGYVAGAATYLGAYYGPYLNAGLTTQNVYAPVDAGQIILPFSAAGVLATLTSVATAPAILVVDSNTVNMSGDAMFLLPVDGGYLGATINNPSNGFAVNGKWLWVYADGVATQQALPPAWRYNLQSTGLPSVATAVGGTGNSSSFYINVNPAADGYLTLDPTPILNGVDGVNQLLAQWNDQTGAPLSIATEFIYTPLYLWPL